MEDLGNIESEHDEVIDLLKEPHNHDGTKQETLSWFVIFKSQLDIRTESWWNLVTFGWLVSLEEDFDELAVVLIKLVWLVHIKFQHLIDLGDSHHDTKSEGGKWDDFVGDLWSHDENEVEIVIDSNKVKDFVKALDHQNALEKYENGCIVIFREHLNEERKKENDELGWVDQVVIVLEIFSTLFL